MKEVKETESYTVHIYGLSANQADNVRDLVLQRVMTEDVQLQVVKVSRSSLED